MAKKRSILTTFVALLLIIAIMLSLNPLPVSAKTTSTGTHKTTGIVTANLLFVREEPSTDSKIIGNVREGNTLTIEEVLETSDKVYTFWLKINYEGKVGYVSQNYVDLIDFEQEETNSESEKKNYIGIVTASGLNLRSKPTTNSDIITVLKHKSLVTVTEVIHTSDKINSTWLKINFNNKVGYVAKQYVDIFEDATANTSEQVGVVKTGLNLRAKPTTQNSKVKEVLSKGDCVNVLDSRTTSDKYGKWYQVRSPSGNIGWVAGKYLLVGQWSLISSAITQSSPNKNRDHNISLACSFINGEVILPKENFSWFRTVGSCSAKKGFQVATIYRNGEISEGYGGGVCQVSTTINIAAKRAGIKTNAHQHSLPVSYASKDDEATVSYPYQNFSFENTLHTPIMIEVISSAGSCMCNVYKLI